jgi:exodeoxyribonuclease VII large subunit
VDGLSRRLVHPAAKVRQQARDAAALSGRLVRAFEHRLAGSATDVLGLAGRLARQFAQPLPQAHLLALAAAALQSAVRMRRERLEARLGALTQNLAHLNPQAVLERGYAIVTSADGAIVQDASGLAVGDGVDLAFARGRAGATIVKIDR